MKNLMYLKKDFVSKESFSRENYQMGLRQNLSSPFEIFYRGGLKLLRSTFFLRYADCQLGGVPRKCQHIVS